MKSLLTNLLTLSYFAIGVFGIFGMHSQADMNMQGHDMAPSNCVAATAKGTDCPKEAGPIDFAVFHLDAFRGFSLATFGENILASFLALVLLVIGTGLSRLLGNYLSSPQLNLAYDRYGPVRFSSPLRQQLLHWLSLHENSPATS